MEAIKGIDCKRPQWKESVETLAIDKIAPIRWKLLALHQLFFCGTLAGKELDGNEWNGISFMMKSMSEEMQSIYDEIYEILGE